MLIEIESANSLSTHMSGSKWNSMSLSVRCMEAGQIMNKAQCPSLFSITSAEARGRILCNYAILQQWLHEAYGEAAATFRRAVEVAPGDPLVIGNFLPSRTGPLNFLSASGAQG